MSKLPFRHLLVVLAIALVTNLQTAIAQSPEVPSADVQIAHSVLALPEAMRDSAAVMGYDADLNLVTLRAGYNGLLCVADKPGDERYSVVCYHESLDPFIARGRALRDEGVEGTDAYKIRHDEMDAGTIPLPEAGAVLYNMSMAVDEFDPETAGPVLYSIYTPYATSATTGIPEAPSGPASPWIMRSGTPSSHVMIVVPKPVVEKEEKEY